MDNRKHHRIDSSNLQVDISDGLGFYSGSVNNLSRFGLCLEDVPEKIRHNAARLSIVISGEGRSFKMFARTRWTEETQRRKSLGVEILNAPWGWTEYVLAREPKTDDPWVELHL